MLDNIFSRHPTIARLIGRKPDDEEIPLGIEAAHCVTPKEPEERAAHDPEGQWWFKSFFYAVTAAVGFLLLATDIGQRDAVPTAHGPDFIAPPLQVYRPTDHVQGDWLTSRLELYHEHADGTWTYSRAM